MRYLICDSVNYEGSRYRFVYDTKYKTFSTVQKAYKKNTWIEVRYVDENFYVLAPGHVKTRESDTYPNWKVVEPEWRNYSRK